MIKIMRAFRLLTVIVLTLLPWPAVWFGMYKLNSLVWTFFLYHGVCLLPAVIWGRNLWWRHVLRPTKNQFAVAFLVATLSTAMAVIAYHLTGTVIVSKQQVLEVLTLRGFHATYLLPLAIYFVFVNATLEELFWRGVVLNELDLAGSKYRRVGYVWTAATFAAWHWLVIKALLRPGYAELAVLGVLALGFLSSWLYRKTQSIVVPIMWHAFVFDFAVIAMFAVLLAS